VITLGMLVIGTPHVGTLALLSFVTLFIPILGAWVPGTVIVLSRSPPSAPAPLSRWPP
jgi:predicted PurR-regulated permease PerM